jgi:hypothetical protein
MTNHKRLTDALRFVDPNVAGDLRRAGRAARDARRERQSDALDDQRVPEGVAARLYAEGREDANHALRKAAAKAKRVAKHAASELVDDETPSAADIEKFAAYHAERVAQDPVPAPSAAIADSTEEVPLEELDIRALSLARRSRNEALQEAAAEKEAQAKAYWVERTGGKDRQGVGFRGHGREQAGRSAPLAPDQKADAEALAEFQCLARSGEAPWLNPANRFHPLEEKVSARTARKDERAARAAQGDAPAQGNRKPCRDKGDCRPAPTRGR